MIYQQLRNVEVLLAILQRKVSAQRCTITRVFYTILIITPWLFFFLYLCMYTYQLTCLGNQKLRSQVSSHQLTNSSHLAEKFELIQPLIFRRESAGDKVVFSYLRKFGIIWHCVRSLWIISRYDQVLYQKSWHL